MSDPGNVWVAFLMGFVSGWATAGVVLVIQDWRRGRCP